MKFRFVRWSFIVVLLSSLCGCGSPAGTLTGEVHLDEHPLDAGSVTLVTPEEGLPVGSAAIAQGKFAFTSPIPVGSYIVTVSPPEEEAPAGADDAADRAAALRSVPEKYWAYTTSDLKVDIQPGDNPPQTFQLSKQ